MENKTFRIDEIYVPVKRRKTLDMKVANEIAESMLEKGQLTPILVRRDGERFVLIEGLHRLRHVRHWARKPLWECSCGPGFTKSGSNLVRQMKTPAGL